MQISLPQILNKMGFSSECFSCILASPVCKASLSSMLQGMYHQWFTQTTVFDVTKSIFSPPELTLVNFVKRFPFEASIAEVLLIFKCICIERQKAHICYQCWLIDCTSSMSISRLLVSILRPHVYRLYILRFKIFLS